MGTAGIVSLLLIGEGLRLSPLFAVFASDFPVKWGQLVRNEEKMPKNEKYLSKCFVINSKSYTFAPLLRTTKAFGRLAQLVQSICLTSRGSAVRIRQRPQKNLKPSLLSTRSYPFGRLAQLVQSICLTSRGSAVRIRQRPQK